MEPLFMQPVFQEKIWGGNRLNSLFGFELPSEQVGENWAISAHPNGVSVILNGKYQGERLDRLWKNHKELFGYPTEKVFPLLIKILDAAEDLSVQVHPDDLYGLEHEGELGKTECWYVIDAEPGAEIVYGHKATTKKELEEKVKAERWGELLRKVPVKKGDFYFVPSGTIHAIGKGIVILETQQSSDTTYRVYDYDRKDAEGKKRELHIRQSLEVTNVPDCLPELEKEETKQGKSIIRTLLQTDFFNVYQWHVRESLTIKKQAPYTLMTVVEGEGELIVNGQAYLLKPGSSCLLPNGISSWQIKGELNIIASEPGK